LIENKNRNFEPIYDKFEPYQTWFAIESDGAFFSVKSKEKNIKLKIYLGRSRCVNGHLHIYIYYDSEECVNIEERSVMLECASVVIKAVKNVYSNLPGYKIYSNYFYEVDILMNQRREWIPIEDIKNYVDVGYSDIYLAKMERNVSIKDLHNKYCPLDSL
jgi:hypothetical protein